MAAKAFVPPDNGPNWWRIIPDCGGKYRVSRNGDVQRIFPDGRVRNMTPYRKKREKPRKRTVCQADS